MATTSVKSGDEQEPLFTFFRKLPVELRFKIWGYASFFKRDVDVTVEEEDYQPAENGPTYNIFAYTSRSLPPAILYVSCEAKSEGLRFYKLAFGPEFALKQSTDPNSTAVTTINNEPQIYVNFEVDRLWLQNGNPDSLEPWIYFFASGVCRVALLGGGHVPDNLLLDPDDWLYWPVEDILLYDNEKKPSFGRRDESGERASYGTHLEIPYRPMDMSVQWANDVQADQRAIETCHNFWNMRSTQERLAKRALMEDMLKDAGLVETFSESFAVEVTEWERPSIELIELLKRGDWEY